MSGVHIGVDCGLTGAIVVLEDGKVEEQYSMPTYKDEHGKKRIDENMLLDLFLLYEGNINSITIEKQQARSGQRGVFAIINHYGWLRGVATMLNCKVFTPRPQEWQPIIDDAELASVYLFAPSSDDPKARSLAAAKILLPDLDLMPGTKRTEQHGISDAGLIALWGSRMYHESDD